jgi:hypothetical protein
MPVRRHLQLEALKRIRVCLSTDIRSVETDSATGPGPMSDFRYRCLLAVCGLGILNFLAFVAGAFVLGGDAANGKIAGGHFYLAEHGKLTEVSEAVYTYSLWHVRSVFLTHPLAILAGYLAKMEQQARKAARRASVGDQAGGLRSST